MVRLNLGCSDTLKLTFMNVDIVPPADLICDLRGPWPWEDSSVNFILANDIIEHLPDKVHTMNEIWRVLRPYGRVEIFVPTTDGRGAWQDPQHCSYWNRNSFLYHTVGVAEYERFKGSLGVRGGFNVVSESEEVYPINVHKLMIVLEAVK